MMQDCPVAPTIKPEGYRAEPPNRDSNCELCRDGWPRIVGERSGHALHELPEPGGSWKCFCLDDPPPATIHACHHVNRYGRITVLTIEVAIIITALAVAGWPIIERILQ